MGRRSGRLSRRNLVGRGAAEWLDAGAWRLEDQVGHIGYVDGEQCNALLAADHSSSEYVAEDEEEEDSHQHH